MVTGWLRNTTTGLVSSVADSLATNPATASGTARPTGNANGSLTFASPNNLYWPVAANNGGNVRWGYAFWIKPTSFATSPIIVGCRPGGADQFQLYFGPDGTVGATIWSAAGVTRGAVSTAVFTVGTKYFGSIEYDGGQAAEADKCVIRMGTSTKLALNFSGAGAGMPATTRTPTVAIIFGAYGTGGGQAVAGDYGRSLYALQGSGGLSGGALLTAAQFDNLKAIDAL